MKARQDTPIEQSVALHSRILQFDGLRALAVMAILIHHALRLPLLWVGVDVFFVLSGFLITGILLARKAKKASYYSYFYKRRAFRIIPPYVLAIVLAGTLFGFANFHPWPLYAFFGMNFVGLYTPAAQTGLPLWSLAVEEQFYLVWPIVILFVSESVLLRLALAAVLFTPLLRAVATPFFPTHYFIYSLTPFRADLLCAGAALTILWKNRLPHWEDLARRFAWIGFLGGFGTLAVVQIWPQFHLVNNTRSANSLDYTFSLIGSASLVIWALAARGWFYRFLIWRPLRFVGRISYMMYLIGTPVRVVTERFIHPKLLVLLVSVTINIAMSSISWYAMERPLIDFAAGKRRFRGKSTKAAQDTLPRVA
jgi:peptidoglycan/LPS O-acetylase OafA/YrhL